MGLEGLEGDAGGAGGVVVVMALLLLLLVVVISCVVVLCMLRYAPLLHSLLPLFFFLSKLGKNNSRMVNTVGEGFRAQRIHVSML